MVYWWSMIFSRSFSNLANRNRLWYHIQKNIPEKWTRHKQSISSLDRNHDGLFKMKFINDVRDTSFRNHPINYCVHFTCSWILFYRFKMWKPKGNNNLIFTCFSPHATNGVEFTALGIPSTTNPRRFLCTYIYTVLTTFGSWYDISKTSMYITLSPRPSVTFFGLKHVKSGRYKTYT